ncbi:MAG: hypothetical protein QM638_02545 [Nocardioides sp.]|uniref:hypothetical protein n=1 Tax=Nocardioides sp. TaxID=35761 RepID=UPI0039E3B056
MPVSSFKRHLNFSNVAAATALVVAVGGGGAAVAATVAHNSVGSPQIKNGQVKLVDLGANSVNGAKVVNGSLSAKELTAKALKSLRAQVAEGPVKTGSLTGSYAAGPTLTYTAPADGVIKVSASLDFAAHKASTYIGAKLTQDGTQVRFSWMDPGDVDTWYDQSQSITGVIPVTAGTHTYTLSMYEYGPTTSAEYAGYSDAQVVVEWFPSGSAPYSSRPIAPRVRAQQ